MRGSTEPITGIIIGKRLTMTWPWPAPLPSVPRGSHCWGDSKIAQYKMLAHVAHRFREKHGRDPTFWFDKVRRRRGDYTRSRLVFGHATLRENPQVHKRPGARP